MKLHWDGQLTRSLKPYTDKGTQLSCQDKSPMLLRSSISSTKMFFQKTLNNVNSFFSGGYHKLPKLPPYNSCSYSIAASSVFDVKNNRSNYKDELDKLDSCYIDFTEKWDSQQDTLEGRNKETAMFSSTTRKDQEISISDGGFVRFSKVSSVKKSNQNQVRTRKQVDSSCSSNGIFRYQKTCVVAQKLRELEILDKGNVDFVLDIEEALHYYSRITSPAYLEMVDKFFMDMYSEFFAPHTRPPSP